MRILFWLPHYLPDRGGMETFAQQLLPELTKLGHQLTIVTSHGAFKVPDVAEINGVIVHRFHFRSALVRQDIGQIAEIRKELARLQAALQPDLIHFHLPNDAIFFHLSTRVAAPTLVTFHSAMGELATDGGSLLGKLVRSAAWVTGVSKQAANSALLLGAGPEERLSVIRNGIARSDVDPAPFPLESPVIIFIGRLASEKGADLAVAALPLILQKTPSARLVIVGSGPERARLEDQVREAGVSDSVEFVGPVPHGKVPEFLNKASLVVMPSRLEGLPLVSLEAGQMGRPIVGTQVGGLPEVIIDNVTGNLVPSEDPVSLAEATIALLGNADELRRLGDAARVRIAEHFSLETCALAYDRLYRQLVLSQA